MAAGRASGPGAGALFAADWREVAVDGRLSAPLEMLCPGALVRLRGAAMRLDLAPGPLRLLEPAGMAELRLRVAQRVVRSVRAGGPGQAVRAACAPEAADAGDVADDAADMTADLGVLAEGACLHRARLLLGMRVLLVFHGSAPAPLSACRVVQDLPRQRLAQQGRPLDIALPQGFAAGTPMATPAGPRAVDTLAGGDVVLTAGGPRRIARVLRADLGSAALRAMPRAAPVLIGHDSGVLAVAPGQALVLGGAGIRGVTGRPLAAVLAQDLADAGAARRAFAARSAVYHAPVLCGGAALVAADGLGCLLAGDDGVLWPTPPDAARLAMMRHGGAEPTLWQAGARGLEPATRPGAEAALTLAAGCV